MVESLGPKLKIHFVIFYNYICCNYKLPLLKMKNLTQKFIRLFTLVFTMSFLINAQCDESLVLRPQEGNNNEANGSYAWFVNNLTLLVDKRDVIYYENENPCTISTLESESGETVTKITFKSTLEVVFTNSKNVF